MANYKQLEHPDMSTRDGPGWCLRFTQTAFRAPVAYPTARVAWEAQKGRHFDTPPLGIRVPIWLDHHGSYGSPPRWDNFGHVAVWLGDGRVLSSPTNAWQGGQKIFGSIREMIAALGNGKYLGWSEYMNGKRIVEPVSNPSPAPTPNPTPTPPSGQEEDEHMPWIAVVGGAWYLVVPTGSGKPNAVVLSGDSGAEKQGFKIVKFASVDRLKKVVNV